MNSLIRLLGISVLVIALISHIAPEWALVKIAEHRGVQTEAPSSSELNLHDIKQQTLVLLETHAPERWQQTAWRNAAEHCVSISLLTTPNAELKANDAHRQLARKCATTH